MQLMPCVSITSPAEAVFAHCMRPHNCTIVAEACIRWRPVYSYREEVLASADPRCNGPHHECVQSIGSK